MPGWVSAGNRRAAEAPAESVETTAPAGVVEVTAAEDASDDFAFVAPAQLASGWTTFRMTNTGHPTISGWHSSRALLPAQAPPQPQHLSRSAFGDKRAYARRLMSSTDSGQAASSLLTHVGGTPLIRLQRASPNPKVEIWAKLELANPTGSLKDRIALHMIEQAEARGELRPGMIIVEATSGNTGIALGMVAAVKGYRLKLFMLENKTLERRKILRHWGVDLVLTSQDDPDSHIYGAQGQIAAEPERYFYINQNENQDNVRAHEQGTGPEIAETLEGKIDAVVAGYGTGGCLTGIARAFRSRGIGARIVAVEPGGEPRAKIDGLKHSSESYQPPIYDRELIDHTIEAPEEETYRVTRELARREGLIAGLSSGACLWAAQRLAKEMESGTIVVVCGDRGERYFSTRLFDAD